MKDDNSSIICIENNIREKKHKLKTSSDEERKRIIEDIERDHPNLSTELREQLRDKGLTTYHLKHIKYGIDKGYDERQLRELSNPEYDIWQVKLICVGFDNGVPFDFIQPYIDSTSFLSFEQRENNLISAINKQQTTVKTKITAATHTVMSPKYKRERG
jgi:hypothetical protein